MHIIAPLRVGRGALFGTAAVARPSLVFWFLSSCVLWHCSELRQSVIRSAAQEAQPRPAPRPRAHQHKFGRPSATCCGNGHLDDRLIEIEVCPRRIERRRIEKKINFVCE